MIPRLITYFLLGASALAGMCLASSAKAQEPHAYTLTGDIAGAHDPSMIRDGNTWYVFTTGKSADGGQFGVRCSSDLQQWQNCGHVFDAIPQWIHERSPGTRDLWAPDINFEHGEFRLYYSYSLFGKNTSGLALATNKTLDPKSPEYRWVDQGLIFESKASDDFNAIDPNYSEDRNGRAWLVFGSFWTGIKMRELNPRSGKLLEANPTLYSLAKRKKPENAGPNPPGLPGNWQAVEAPFLVQHGGYYYLFVSFDLCCRGTKSTYRTMVGRAKSVTGPYLDRNGVSLANGGGSELLTGNSRWLGPGGESVVLSKRKGDPDLIVYHAYDSATGRPSLHLSTIFWKDGWPEAALAQ
ncbi:arabinan endo-1,5-alpha-L-arabinosidase [Terriglobus sp.]|uniref:arabinan endo-1,5-alpha-L-arabinosidase n=1 Tax=Terriglobus sp. TaxID=1889013 RepID=UPI003B000073